LRDEQNKAEQILRDLHHTAMATKKVLNELDNGSESYS